MAAAFRGMEVVVDFTSAPALGPKLPSETTPPRTTTPGIAGVPLLPEPPGPRAEDVPLLAFGLDPGPGPLPLVPEPAPAAAEPAPPPRAMPPPSPTPPTPACP